VCVCVRVCLCVRVCVCVHVPLFYKAPTINTVFGHSDGMVEHALQLLE